MIDKDILAAMWKAFGEAYDSGGDPMRAALEASRAGHAVGYRAGLSVAMGIADGVLTRLEEAEESDGGAKEIATLIEAAQREATS